MGTHWQKTALVTILTVLLVGIAVSGCVPSSPSPAQSSTTTPITKTYIYIDGGIVVRGSGEPVELINNPNATNPTFVELVAFLERDRTNEYSYIVGPPKNAFICTDFAETLHNNAEAAGIRAAWVAIDIEGQAEGHALNAFQTTDWGLVYIDSTGPGIWTKYVDRTGDRRAFVEIGQPYGVADLDREATSFEFFIYVGQTADNIVGIWLEEQTLRSLEELGWLQLPTYEERSQRTQQVLEWVRTHDIRELGTKWVQEWIREHEAELHGQEFMLYGSSTITSSYFEGSEWPTTQITWCIDSDALGGSWFRPEGEHWYGTVEEKVRMVDGIPVVWQVTWYMNAWSQPFIVFSDNQIVSRGVVEDIYIHWGE